MSYKKNELLLNFTDIDVSKFNFTKAELPKNINTNGQLIGFIDYAGDTALIQTPWITMNTHGIPPLSVKNKETGIITTYFENDTKREFINIPIDISNKQTNSEVLSFHEFISDLDARMVDTDIIEKILGKKFCKKYKYSPILKGTTEEQTDVNEDSDENEKTSSKDVKPQHIKIKIDVDYNTKNIKTRVWDSVEDNNGVRTRTEIKDIASITELAGIIKYKSRVRLVLRPAKTWAQPSTKKDPEYGFTFKLFKIEVEPPGGSSANNDNNETTDFIDYDNTKVKTINNVLKDLESEKSHEELVSDSKEILDLENESESDTELESKLALNLNIDSNIESNLDSNIDSNLEPENISTMVIKKETEKILNKIAEVDTSDEETEPVKKVRVNKKLSKR